MEEDKNDSPAYKRRVLIRPKLFVELTKLADDNDTDPTEETNRAVREYLERCNRWPPRGDINADPPVV